MDYVIEQVAQRIKGLREMLDISKEHMAEATNTSLENYIEAEEGKNDFSFTFLYLCAEQFGVDLIDLLLGESPKLSFYSIIRSGKGMSVKRRSGLEYKHLAYTFKDKTAEPFLVTAPYAESEQDAEIPLSFHEGQEFDYVLSGSLKVRFEDKVEILGPGDCVYYDSGRGHGMIATDKTDCVFLAIVIKKD